MLNKTNILVIFILFTIGCVNLPETTTENVEESPTATIDIDATVMAMFEASNSKKTVKKDPPADTQVNITSANTEQAVSVNMEATIEALQQELDNTEKGAKRYEELLTEYGNKFEALAAEHGGLPLNCEYPESWEPLYKQNIKLAENFANTDTDKYFELLLELDDIKSGHYDNVTYEPFFELRDFRIEHDRKYKAWEECTVREEARKTKAYEALQIFSASPVLSVKTDEKITLTAPVVGFNDRSISLRGEVRIIEGYIGDEWSSKYWVDVECHISGETKRTDELYNGALLTVTGNVRSTQGQYITFGLCTIDKVE